MQKDSEGIMSEQQQARLRGVYEALVVVQREAVSSMSRILRNLPASCYHPQASQGTPVFAWGWVSMYCVRARACVRVRVCVSACNHVCLSARVRVRVFKTARKLTLLMCRPLLSCKRSYVPINGDQRFAPHTEMCRAMMSLNLSLYGSVVS
eukprot:775144-Pelagomonas_calceolata.AAC.5